MFAVNSEFRLKDRGVSNAVDTESLPRHRWYFVKEGFSPKFVEQAMRSERLEPGDLVVDPFSGSGTVALAGVSAGLRVEACEVNPFLRFLSSAKLCSMRSATFLEASHAVLGAMREPAESKLEGYSTFTRGNRWGRWLFPLSVLRAFEAGRRAAVRLESSSERTLLLIALIGAAMDCCNATRDGKCLRFRRHWKRRQVTGVRVRARFEARTKMIASDLEDSPLEHIGAHVIEGDARARIGDRREKFRMCITSPPYLNSFDYSDVYRPELFLGGFVSSTEELRRIRLQTIRSHVQASWEKPEKEEFGIVYEECARKLQRNGEGLWDKRLLTMVQAYFEDMERVLKALRSRAMADASLWLVVSTSAYGGVEIPVDLIIAELGQRTGWFLREIGVLRYLRSSSQHIMRTGGASGRSVPLRESVVILDASRTSVICMESSGASRPAAN